MPHGSYLCLCGCCKMDGLYGCEDVSKFFAVRRHIKGRVSAGINSAFCSLRLLHAVLGRIEIRGAV